MTIRQGFLTGGMRKDQAFHVPEKNLLLISVPYGLELFSIDSNFSVYPGPQNLTAFGGSSSSVLFWFNRYARRGMLYDSGQSYLWCVLGDTWQAFESPIAVPTGFSQLQYSQGGDFIAIGSTQYGVRIYHSTTFALLRTISFSGAVIHDIAWSPNDGQLAVAYAASPYIKVFDFGTEAFLSDPATIPTGVANGCAWSPVLGYLAVAHNTTPFVSIYQMPAFTKIANPPAGLPDGNGRAVRFTRNAIYLTVLNESSYNDYSTVYSVWNWNFMGSAPWSSSTEVTDFTYNDIGGTVWAWSSVVQSVYPTWTSGYMWGNMVQLTKHLRGM